eukprot:7073179-Pyramimonas_sp.AAC.1
MGPESGLWMPKTAKHSALLVSKTLEAWASAQVQSSWRLPCCMGRRKTCDHLCCRRCESEPII